MRDAIAPETLSTSFVVFTVAGARYALEAAAIRETLHWRPAPDVKRGRDGWIGVAVLGSGLRAPVFELRRRRAVGADRAVLATLVPDGVIGLAVDAVAETLRLEPDLAVPDRPAPPPPKAALASARAALAAATLGLIGPFGAEAALIEPARLPVDPRRGLTA